MSNIARFFCILVFSTRLCTSLHVSAFPSTALPLSPPARASLLTPLPLFPASLLPFFPPFLQRYVEELTEDHHPSRVDERERIEAAGGSIRNGRVEGVVAVTRSFGDIEYKTLKEESWGHFFQSDLLTAQPETCSRVLEPGDILILGSDGLYDAFPDPKVENVVDLLLKVLVTTHGDLQKAVQEVLAAAEAEAMCRDNVTIVAVMVT
jgi:serine/threonine protein phosphatase PrpC